MLILEDYARNRGDISWKEGATTVSNAVKRMIGNDWLNACIKPCFSRRISSVNK